MPNILQIAITAGGGSIGSIATQIGDTFVDTFGGKSFITYHFRCHPSKSPKNTSIKVGNKCTFLVHLLMTRLFDAHGYASWHDTKKLIQLIEKEHIDIVHLHNIHGYYVNIEMLIQYLAQHNIPVVWTIHDCWNFTGHCAHFFEVGCNMWKSGCEKCPYKSRYPGSLLFNRSKTNYKKKNELFHSLSDVVLVPVSDWEKNMLQESFMKDMDIRRIYNGIDLNIFHPCDNASEMREELNLENKFVILGVATGWGPDKGTLDYIELSKHLPVDMQIVLVGIPKDMKPQFPETIMCLPRTLNQQQLAEYYSMADVVTNLSSQESFGLTPVEGMACGTPAIVYNNTSQPELIDISTGFKVETGNVKGVIACLLEVKDKGKAYYSNKCRKRAELLFDKDECYNQYMNIYKELLKL